MNNTMRAKYLQPLALLIALGTNACGSDSGTNTQSTTQKNTIEIYSWWTAGGEAQALSTLIDLYKGQYKDHDVLNSTGSVTGDKVGAAFDTMKTRLAKNDPPDSWQAILGKNLVSYTRFVPADADPKKTDPVNTTLDLTDLYKSEGWADKFPPGVLAAMKDGNGTYAVPLSVGRINELFYNMAIFDKYKLSPPETIDDLWKIGEALKDKTDGHGDPIIPMVISSGYDVPHAEAWPVRFVFDAVLMAEKDGIKFRQDYYSGKADPADPAYLQGATDFDKLLTMYTNAGNEALAATGSDAHALKLQWEGAADMVHSGRAAMFLHGNWVKAYLESKGDVADTDFGVVQFPRKAFVYAGDSFVVSKDAPHMSAALDFLKLIGSPDAQSTFNKKKGALPARIDADTSDFDTIGKHEAADFRDPSVSLVPCSWDYEPADYWNCWQDAVFAEVKDHDPAAFASACVSKYSLLTK
jgi:glucose/mannose transport system substrate-binding protein